jgi:hypothetical protein
MSGGLYFAPVACRDISTALYLFLIREYSIYKLIKLWIIELLRCGYRNFVQGYSIRLSEFNIISGSEFQRIVVTWGKAGDFHEESLKFKDRYFKDSFDNDETFRIIQVSDVSDPQTPRQSVVLKRRRRFGPDFVIICRSLLKFFGHAMLVLYRFEGSLRERFVALLLGICYFSQRFQECFKIAKLLDVDLKNKIKLTATPQIWIAYEAQPEQTVIIKFLKKNFPEVSVVGYIHSTLGIFPAHLLKPFTAIPDVLQTHGSAYKKVIKKFGWKNTPILLGKSIRYKQDSNEIICIGSISFPYSKSDFLAPYFVIQRLVNAERVNLVTIRPHPVTGLSQSTHRLFESLLMPYSSSRQPCGIIAIGNTSVPLEQLERGISTTVYHIPLSESVLESYDNGLWDDYLSFERIEGAIRIELKSMGAFIKFV